jgi:hypothetical protein
MKKIVATSALIMLLASSANAQETCTRGEMITGAAVGAGLGAVTFGGPQVRAFVGVGQHFAVTGTRSVVGAQATGGAIIGGALGAYGGCIAGPLTDRLWEDSYAQAAYNGATTVVVDGLYWSRDQVVGAGSWVGGNVNHAWNAVSGGVSDWWNTPTDIEKRTEVPSEEDAGVNE